MNGFFGYVLIHNFSYPILIEFDQKKLNNQKLTIDKNYFETKDFKFIGKLSSFSPKNGLVYSKVNSEENSKEYTEGFYTIIPITKKELNIIKSYSSPYSFLLENLDKRLPSKQLNRKNKIIGSFKVMTLNVCNDFIWTGNKGIKDVIKILKDKDPDIILFQELSYKNFQKLKSYLPDWKFANISTCILSKFPIVKELERIPLSPIFGVIIEINGDRIRVFNSHLDDNGYYNLEESKKYQLPNLEYGLYSSVYPKKFNPELPTIIAGDHNTPSHLDIKSMNFPVTKKFEKDGWIDTYRFVNKKIKINKDFTWPNCNTIPKIISNEVGKICENKARIDYIYSNSLSGLYPIDSEIVNFSNDKFPSDHYGVLTEFLHFQN